MTQKEFEDLCRKEMRNPYVFYVGPRFEKELDDAIREYLEDDNAD